MLFAAAWGDKQCSGGYWRNVSADFEAKLNQTTRARITDYCYRRMVEGFQSPVPGLQSCALRPMHRWPNCRIGGTVETIVQANKVKWEAVCPLWGVLHSVRNTGHKAWQGRRSTLLRACDRICICCCCKPDFKFWSANSAGYCRDTREAISTSPSDEGRGSMERAHPLEAGAIAAWL